MKDELNETHKVQSEAARGHLEVEKFILHGSEIDLTGNPSQSVHNRGDLSERIREESQWGAGQNECDEESVKHE